MSSEHNDDVPGPFLPDNGTPALAAPWRSFVVIDTETNGLDEHTDPAEANPDPRVLEIAAVRFDDGAPTRSFSSLIDIGDAPISPRAAEVHGITHEKLVGAPSMAEAWRGVHALYDAQVQCTVTYNGMGAWRTIENGLALCESCVRLKSADRPKTCGACAYRDRTWSGFDVRFLLRDVAKARELDPTLPKPPRSLMPPWADACTWAKHDAINTVRYGKGQHTLEAVAKRLGVSLENAHRAEADATATGYVWLALAPKIIATVQSAKADHILATQSVIGEQLQQRVIDEQLREAANQQRGFQRWLAKQPKQPAPAKAGAA